MTSYSGVTWRVDYGEISEREQFRVGRLNLESYDAYFPLSQLQDLIDTLNAVTPLGLNLIARGNQVQAVKVSDGLLTSVVISPRLDTGTPVESMRLPLSELTDLLYALSLFRADMSALPDDWDFSKPNPINEASLPKYLQQAELSATFVSLKQAAKNPDLLIVGSITRDANQAVTSAEVVWPDGTPGTFTAETLSTAFPGAVDGYRITYGSPVTKTFTQPAITRNSAGAATTVPQIVMS